MSLEQKLLGSWELVDCKVIQGGTLKDLPIGPADQCGGFLIYSPDGIVSATISRLDRPPFQDSSVHGGTSEEKLRAYESIISYVAEFEVDEPASTVTHHIRYGTFPNWVNSKQIRKCTFAGETLRLDAPPMLVDGGDEQATYLVWRRVGDEK